MFTPWWPTFFPFGPAITGTAQAAGSYFTTTTSRPSTTSPWWVPDPATTTTSRPSTTSPWWVPDPTISTTTSRPSATSSSTSKPSTTSPWWVPESTTTTTTRKPSAVPSTSPVVIDSSAGGNTASCGAGPYRTLSVDEQERIVGGTTATRNSWPFLVSIMIFSTFQIGLQSSLNIIGHLNIRLHYLAAAGISVEVHS